MECSSFDICCIIIFYKNFRIRDELKCGEEYWALERKLCSALTNKQEVRCVIPMELEFMIPFLEMEFNSFEFHVC